MGLSGGDAPLQVGHDLVEGVAQRRAVGREHQHEHSERAEHDEVKRPVDGDQAQHDLVAQGLAPERQLDLVALGREAACGDARVRASASQLSQRRQRYQRVPAASCAREDRILRAQLGRVGPDELVAAQRAQQELPVQARSPAPGRLGTWRVLLPRANGTRRSQAIGDTQSYAHLGGRR